MESFDGWAVSVQTDPNVISPLNVSFGPTDNLFEANYSITPVLVSTCVNNSGNGCSGSYGPGIVSLVGNFQPGTPPPVLGPGDSINGTLFTITYKVIAASGFSRIMIIQSSTTFNYSFGGQYHVVPYTTLDNRDPAET